MAALIPTLVIAWVAGFGLGGFVTFDMATLTLYALWQGVLTATLAYMLWAGPSKGRPGKPDLDGVLAPAERRASAEHDRR